MKRTCKEIRREFIEFFEKRGHAFVPSSSLLPADDPTLLFANAGMNQFKDIFLGREKRSYVRAANSQKCIRAGGKHNDLEDVGLDTYHHTFFEMLGNWSFGDYFKAESIQWAWELLTEVWGLEKNRLHATYFGGDKAEHLEPDTEARDLWLKYLPAERIHPGSKKDNFWEMGETGPCGPCSEIHIDLTDDLSGANLVNKGDRRVMEIWNLVFMQFNRGADGKLAPLPAKHVDTGMGLERVGMVIQGRQSNYATDLFAPIIEKIETLTKHRYGQQATGHKDEKRFDTTDAKDLGDVAMRVIADHARSLTFAIADGIIPSNEGRGYVLRRILRRAARYGRQYLNIEGPFLVKLVPTIVSAMGESFPEIQARQTYVEQTIGSEEESFGKTLDRGIDLFQKQADKLRAAGTKELSGEIAFDLYATYGFPIDLTQIMAAEIGLKVDVAGFEHAMAEHREASAGAGDKFKVLAITGLPETDDSAKYDNKPTEAKVLGWVIGDKFITEGGLSKGDEAAVVLDRTNFYGEQGGQVGDAGKLAFPGGWFAVRDTQVAGHSVLHVGVVEDGTLRTGQAVAATVDGASRFDTMRNHTATHLLNGALRAVLGEHVNQAGSVVAPDRLRFDFTHNQALTPEQLTLVETKANEMILADLPVQARTMPLAEAKKIPGVRAVFGEKYPDPVRVITVGGPESPVSAEFCGGAHLSRTSQAGVLKIVAEESVAKGVRRITALTGPEAVKHVREMDQALRQIGQLVRAGLAELPARVAALQKEIKELRKRPAGGAGESAESKTVYASGDGKVQVVQVPHADGNAMRTFCDVQRQKGATAILVGGTDGEKVALVAMVDDAVAQAGKLKAGDWVKAAAAVMGGSGGGKPTLAQAGGKDPAKLPEALEAAAGFVKDKA